MNPSIARLVCLLLALTMTLVERAAFSQDNDAPVDVSSLISELGLKESPTALRDQPGWRRPGAVIVQQSDGYDLEQLRAAAPQVEIIPVRDLAEAVAAAPRADAVIGFCSPELLARGTRIRWVQAMSAGVEYCVGIPALAEREILLTNLQRVAGPVMAEHVMAMTLALARRFPEHLQRQNEGRWEWRMGEESGMLVLQGKTMLVVGLGGIGTETARRAHAFGMRIIATDASDRPAPDFVSHLGSPGELLSLIPQADVIVNALPLTPQTEGLFNAQAFAAMRPKAIFVNVGRGKTVVTDELVKALQEGRLGGAGLDVTEPEPLPADHPLWSSPNTIITPHVATQSDLGQERRWAIAIENLRRYVAGERMLSVVDVKRGY